MGDFASVIGGGPIVGLDGIPSDLDGFYKIMSDNLSLDLADHTGSNVVDGSENEGEFSVSLGSGADVVYGGRSDDTVDGGSGADSVAAGSGDDLVAGGAGVDTLLGQDGDDTLAGNAGYDSIDGGQGDDVLQGGAGYDLLDGGAGDDLLQGGAGYDTLEGGAGDDILIGGAGQDTFLFSSGFGSDVIADFDGGKDVIWLTAGINGTGINNARDVADYVTGDAGSTTITIGEDSIKLEGVGKDDFLAHLTAWVKVV